MEQSAPPSGSQRQGNMVGLFWIEAQDVYLGMPPVAAAPGVLLTPAGLRVVGPDPQFWEWPAVHDLRVSEVPVRSTLTRWATRAVTMAAAALDAWFPGSPTEMTVTVTTTQGDEFRTTVLSGADTAYAQQEADLSHRLLARFARGEGSPTALTDWWNGARPTAVLRSRQREALLQRWVAAAD
ncbi:hypothetical protein [Streptomyces sp. NBC_00859]|uniref:hypothetical protein n=1 Tax=Streptomyces sp. NBC_00859 TaxID=2903682 RepID=UPI003869F74E|nr:hypothetical protein OG584_16720 [Streptomyces sp. NBC_00859]